MLWLSKCFCNLNSGNDKASIKAKVGYYRLNLLVLVLEVKSLKEFNKERLKKCNKNMNRMNYKGYGIIKYLFEEDSLEFFKLLDSI
ncbi:hypothetical protein E4V42_21970 [Clostridium estertheticum]|uniref:Uncharacterized protein n=1 Tax=Clostridium estertheticum TaxID=238834 RepID=A0A5N7IUX4_9CLOT|nr:hypothetical protein [Clostridium estertheticum]MPQ34062.1 hypothetical protein [Clostridium estertheticum]MPQ64863.1 hypothetical protein [Clostridium estertheticum]